MLHAVRLLRVTDSTKIWRKIRVSGHRYSLRPATALNIFRAFDYAKYIGLPLNVFVTLKFIDSDQYYGRKSFSKIRQAINRWLRNISRKESISITPTWVFTFENPHDHFHVHWLIHLPEKHRDRFENKVIKLLKKYQDLDVEDNQLNFQDVNPYTDKTIANYMCKGIRRDFIEFFHLQDRASPQGYVQGQRARVSKNIGPKAIKSSGFQASQQREEWEKIHPELASKYQKPDNWNLDEVVPQKTKAKTFENNRKRLGRSARRPSRPGQSSYRRRSNSIVNELIRKQLRH